MTLQTWLGIALIVGAFLLLIGWLLRYVTQVVQMPRPEVINWAAVTDEKLQYYLPQRWVAAMWRYQDLTGADMEESYIVINYIWHFPEIVDRAKRMELAIDPYDIEGVGIVSLIDAGQFDEAVERYARFVDVDTETAKRAIEDIVLRREARAEMDALIMDLVATHEEQAISIYSQKSGATQEEATLAVLGIHADVKEKNT